MHIQELILKTRQLVEQKEFYCNILGLPLLNEMDGAFTVQAGRTRLRFEETGEEVLYHVAFTIPRNMFVEAKGWVRERVPLLQKDGKDEIFFGNLNARSFYFGDAEGNILEYIVHYGLEEEKEGKFGGNCVLHMSEIGLPVEDVPAFAGRLREEVGVEPYGGSIAENFAFMGDIWGQLVVVKVGRPWLPTETVRAVVAPVEVRVSGEGRRRVEVEGYPYRIVVEEKGDE